MIVDTLKGQVALVTGAARGNGAAIAQGFAAAGANVVIVDILEAEGEQTAANIRAEGGLATFMKMDVRDVAEIQGVASKVASEIGDLSILVNNAGVCPREKLDDPGFRAGWDSAMGINLEGVMNTTLAFLDPLRRQKGVIINISSVMSLVANKNTSVAYAASKAGVKLLTQGLALELGRDGVRVNAIAPGFFVTEMNAVSLANKTRMAEYEARIPLGRVADPKELIGPAIFLASSMASYVTGTTLIVDGGLTSG